MSVEGYRGDTPPRIKVIFLSKPDGKTEKTMKQIINAKIVTRDGVLEDKALLFDEKIVGFSDTPTESVETVDAEGLYLIPGLIDLHIHGCCGVGASDGSVASIRTMAEGLLKNGVTAFLPTTMTLSYEQLEKSFDAVRAVMYEGGTANKKNADVLGIHAEGPFVNEKKKGAQNPKYIKKLDADFVLKHKDVIKLLTVAPETDEDFEGIKRLKAETDIVLSMGHTDADYETAKASLKAGISHATHLFNAMTPITHREPGAAGAALFSPEVSCELICDGFHINSALFEPVYRLKGEKLNLITDSIACAGMPDGEYMLGGLKHIKKGIECRLPDGTIAGSVLTLNEAVRNLHKAGVPLHEAVNAASLYPAMTLGIENERGEIKKDLLADFSLCDGEFNIKKVFKRGRATARRGNGDM